MVSSTDLVSALLLGLLSLPHCMAMCGGIAMALLGSSRVAGETGRSAVALQMLGPALQYGTGKLFGYMLLGAIAGLSGNLLANAAGSGAAAALRLFAAVVLVAAGLHAGGWWRGLRSLERLTYPLWRRLSTILRRLDSARGSHRLILGAGWGLIPCGIVYTALALALASGSVAGGMLIMLVFGLGTLPFVLLAGGAMGSLQVVAAHPCWKPVAGILLIMIGLIMLLNH